MIFVSFVPLVVKDFNTKAQGRHKGHEDETH